MKKLAFLAVSLTLLGGFTCNRPEVQPEPVNPFAVLVATHTGTCFKTFRDLSKPLTTVKKDTTLNSKLTIINADANNLKVSLESCSALTGGYSLSKNAQTSTADSLVFEFSMKGTGWSAEAQLIFIKSKNQIQTTSRQFVTNDNETSYSATYQIK